MKTQPVKHNVKLRLFAVLLVAIASYAGLTELRSNAQSAAQSSARLLVKVRAPLSDALEAALPLQTMELIAGQTGNAQVDQFLSQYSAHKARPLYTGIVRLKKQRGLTDLQVATAAQQRFPLRAKRLHAAFRPPQISRTYVFELDGAAANNLQGLLQALRSDPNVEFAEEDHIVSTNLSPNDPYSFTYGSWGQPYYDLWGMYKIGCFSAWNTSTGAGTVVAVVDTGIDFTHPDIVANIWTNPGEIAGNGIDDDGNGYVDDVHGWDFIGHTYTTPAQSNNPVDNYGHGTHVSGTIAAVGNNGIGIIGVAWNAKIMPVKGLDDSGFGLDSTLGPAIIYGGNNGADVISNSWSGTGTSQTIAEAVRYVHNLGAVVVAAAGNASSDALNYYPANLPEAITVAASDTNDALASFSNFGSKIDVAAPGVDILSLRAGGTSLGTTVGTNYTRLSGTSMATPHVSGLAALILSQHPDYSNEDVRQVLRVSATDLGTPGYDLKFGYGRVSASSAVGVPSVLEAKIIAPGDGTSIAGPVTLTGYARGNNFAQYTLAYGLGAAPSTWTVFAGSGTPVGNAPLGVFDPTFLNGGLYTIQLVSYDVSNHAFVDQIQLTSTLTTSITSPIPSTAPSTAIEFKPGVVIPVTGSAVGPGFQSYTLDWAEGINPSSGWSTTGMSGNSGTTPVLNGALGSWDTSSITQRDFYTIRLSVNNNGTTNVVTTLVYLDSQLVSAEWPQFIAQAPVSGGLVPAADSQGNLRLTGEAPFYSGLNQQGQFWWFPSGGGAANTVSLNTGGYFQPAVGSLEGTVEDQVIVADGQNIDVFQQDNSFTTFSASLPVTFQSSQITLQDLDNTSNYEALALGENSANSTAYLYAFKKDGAQFGNFPIAISDQNLNLGSTRTGPRVLVGDLNGDGNRKIIVQAGTSSSTSSLLLFSDIGAPLTWSAPTLNGYPTEMALADLDHNGKLETLILVATPSQIVLHVLQPNGAERTGWPIALATYAALSYLAVGDITQSGSEQIVVSNWDNIYVLNADGSSFSSGWPILHVPGAIFGAPVLADVNGDGKPEIVLTQYYPNTFTGPLNPGGAPPTTITYDQLQVLALRADGSSANSWNLFGANGVAPSDLGVVTVGEFNHSGTTKIAVLYPLVLGAQASSVAAIFDTGAPFLPSANNWPMIFQNPRNTATRIVDVTPPAIRITSPAYGTTVGGQVTVTAGAIDNVGVTGVQFLLDGANFGSVITAAPFSIVWDTTQASLGSHTLAASATDAAGNVTTSAPVTVTVEQFATVTLSPGSLAFGTQQVNTTSAPQTITVTNASVFAAGISAVAVSGDFAQTNNCVTTLTPAATCTITVTYTPTVRGSETGTVTLTGNLTGGAQVTLSGSGQALTAALSPSAMSFSAEPVGTSSSAGVFTYSNTGDLPVAISGISVSGDFSEISTCGASLAAGSSCSVSVTFTPSARGSRSGSLSILGNVNSSAALTGTGQAALISVSPSSINFGTQAVNTTSTAQLVTITNTGDLSYYINGWSIGGAFAVTNNCPFTLAPGANCNFSLTFTPTSSGSYQGTFSFSGSFPGSPASVSLSGTGQDTAAILSPTSLTFGSQSVNTSSTAQTIFLVNTANTPVNVSAIQVTGDFAQTNNCGASVAVSSSCSISVTFHPSVSGSRSGSLTVSSNTRVAIPPATLSGNRHRRSAPPP